MKNNTILLLVAGLLATSSAIAAEKKGLLKQADEQISGQGYGLAGCGLGSILLGDQKGFVQIFAATLNGTSGNQTFGISTGTSNCDATAANKTASVQVFVAANRQALEKDAARGNGESLDSLSRLMGCDSAVLGARLQTNYSIVFGNRSAPAEQISAQVLQLGTECGV